MLRIGICDDEERDLDIICAFTMELLASLNIEYHMQRFTNGYKLIELASSFDLILLDIEMDEINGMDVARSIRTNNHDIKIVFVTNSQNYLRVGYTVKADGYFIKPIDKIEFHYELTNVLEDYIRNSKFIFDKRISPNKIYLSDIFYIEFYDRKTLVHLKDTKLATYITLKEWIALLKDYHFAQCHKAYVINLYHIGELKTDKIILTTGDEINLSRKYKTEFRLKYLSSIGGRC